MVNNIGLYFFILSIVYNLKFILEFLVKLREENPKPLIISNVEKIVMYFTISYIITYIIS